MKLMLDTNTRPLELVTDTSHETYDLYSTRSLEEISNLWLNVGWNQKYVYPFTWLGRPIIQLPEDLMRIQEITYRVRPDVIIETGIAHGGSLIYYASPSKAMGKGRVVGIDIEIRLPNRR